MSTDSTQTFSFSAPGRIVFGAGAASQLPDLVAGAGRRPFVVTGSHPGRVAGVLDGIVPAGAGQVDAEPTVQAVRALTDAARGASADMLVAVGGGSVIDAAKAVAVLLANGTDVLDHLEVVGRGEPITKPSLPVIAVPTTAGTGSECSANAVVMSPEHQLKASLRHASMIPAVALVDPELTLGCPPAVTASAGLDAFTQVLEPFVSPMATPMTDALALQALGRAGALRRAHANGSDLAARTDMALVSLYGGLCLANAKLGAVHGFAGPLGGMIDAAHGALCGALLAPCIEANLRALRERDADSPALDRYRQAAVAVTGRADATTDDLLAWVRETVRLLGVGTVADLGLTPERHEEAARKAAQASSMKGNPIELTHDELLAVLRA